ncbi:MAG: class I SAM-dependent methyltransferase [Ruminiclostridium sp.]|nr:class I SAM-dependent methyltransferase [Ruminiclostridium sp.]
MGFYEQISKYYDHIFPTGKHQIDFIETAAGIPPKKILDIACGSGGYSAALAKAGYSVTAIDLDEKMVEMTFVKKHKDSVDIVAMVCNLLDISRRVGSSAFDLAFCIGNSIAHLGSKEDISDALGQMHSCLQPGGILITQIINFDRVFRHNISSLPTIVNEEAGLNFIRKYSYDEKKGLIKFNTLLTVDRPGGREEYENTIELLPLLSADMMELMKKAGFKDVLFFGDFEYSKYGEDSFMLVVKCTA